MSSGNSSYVESYMEVNKSVKSNPNITKPSNTSVEDFKFIVNEDLNISSMPGFDKFDSNQIQNNQGSCRNSEYVKMNNQQGYTQNIKECSEGIIGKFKNTSFKSKSYLLKSSNARKKYKFSKNKNFYRKPTFKFRKMNGCQQDNSHNIIDRSRGFIEKFKNQHLKSESNLSKSSNTNIEDLKFTQCEMDDHKDTHNVSVVESHREASQLLTNNSLEQNLNLSKSLNAIDFKFVLNEDLDISSTPRISKKDSNQLEDHSRTIDEIWRNKSLYSKPKLSKTLCTNVDDFKFVVNEDLQPLKVTSKFNKMDSDQLHETLSEVNNVLTNKSFKSNLTKPFNCRVEDFEVPNNDLIIMPTSKYRKVDNFQLDNTNNIEGCLRGNNGKLKNESLRQKSNLSKSSNISIEDFKLSENENVNVAPTFEFCKTDMDYRIIDYQQYNIHNIQESHKGFDGSLKSKSHLSKQFNVCENDFKILNDDISITPTYKNHKKNMDYQQDYTYNNKESHRDVDEMLKNRSLKPKSNLSKSLNDTVKDFETFNDDLIINPIPECPKMDMDYRIMGFQQDNTHNIQEHHIKVDEMLTNTSLNPKSNLSKLLSINLSKLIESHRDVDEMLKNRSLKPKSNQSKSLNANVKDFETFNDDLIINPIPECPKMDMDYRIMGFQQVNTHSLQDMNKGIKSKVLWKNTRDKIFSKKKLKSRSRTSLKRVTSVTTHKSVLETREEKIIASIVISDSDSDEDFEKNTFNINAFNVISEIDESLSLTQSSSII